MLVLYKGKVESRTKLYELRDVLDFNCSFVIKYIVSDCKMAICVNHKQVNTEKKVVLIAIASAVKIGVATEKYTINSQLENRSCFIQCSYILNQIGIEK